MKEKKLVFRLEESENSVVQREVSQIKMGTDPDQIDHDLPRILLVDSQKLEEPFDDALKTALELDDAGLQHLRQSYSQKPLYFLKEALEYSVAKAMNEQLSETYHFDEDIEKDPFIGSGDPSAELFRDQNTNKIYLEVSLADIQFKTLEKKFQIPGSLKARYELTAQGFKLESVTIQYEDEATLRFYEKALTEKRLDLAEHPQFADCEMARVLFAYQELKRGVEEIREVLMAKDKEQKDKQNFHSEKYHVVHEILGTEHSMLPKFAQADSIDRLLKDMKKPQEISKETIQNYQTRLQHIHRDAVKKLEKNNIFPDLQQKLSDALKNLLADIKAILSGERKTPVLSTISVVNEFGKVAEGDTPAGPRE